MKQTNTLNIEKIKEVIGTNYELTFAKNDYSEDGLNKNEVKISNKEGVGIWISYFKNGYYNHSPWAYKVTNTSYGLNFENSERDSKTFKNFDNLLKKIKSMVEYTITQDIIKKKNDEERKSNLKTFKENVTKNYDLLKSYGFNDEDYISPTCSTYISDINKCFYIKFEDDKILFKEEHKSVFISWEKQMEIIKLEKQIKDIQNGL